MGSEKNTPLTSKFNVAVEKVALSLLSHGMYTQLLLHESPCSVWSVIYTGNESSWEVIEVPCAADCGKNLFAGL